MVTYLQVKVNGFFERGPVKSRLVALLASLVLVEALGLVAGALFFFAQIFVQPATSVVGAVVIFIVTAIIAAGLVATGIFAFTARSWTRGAILTWQILQLAVATSFVQGLTPWPAIGVALIVLSLGCAALLFVPAVVRSTTKEHKTD
jgi:hypothetical protein